MRESEGARESEGEQRALDVVVDLPVHAQQQPACRALQVLSFAFRSKDLGDEAYRGTSPIRNTYPPRITIGPSA